MREGTCHPYLYVVVGLFVLYSSTNFDIKTCVYTCIHMYTIIHKYIGNAYARTYVFTCLLSYMYMCVDMGSCTHTHATHKTSTYLPTYLPIPPYLPPCLLSACLPLYIHSFIHAFISFNSFIHVPTPPIETHAQAQRHKHPLCAHAPPYWLIYTSSSPSHVCLACPRLSVAQHTCEN